jgi:hypothetical protein
MAESILKEEEEDQRAFLFADFERMLLECKSDDKSQKTFLKSTEKYHEKTNPTPAMWRRDFKISGSITDAGGLSLVSLNRQIRTGIEKGHTETEIIEGVIRRITPGVKLRSYLEGKEELTLTELRGIRYYTHTLKNKHQLNYTKGSAMQHKGSKSQRLSLSCEH